jgi:hypothetical protein
MLTKKSWEEFRATGLFWLLNHTLHLFGWAIVYETKDGRVAAVYPARTKYRGFTEEDTENGFKRVTTYLKDNINELHKEAFE